MSGEEEKRRRTRRRSKKRRRRMMYAVASERWCRRQCVVVERKETAMGEWEERASEMKVGFGRRGCGWGVVVAGLCGWLLVTYG